MTSNDGNTGGEAGATGARRSPFALGVLSAVLLVAVLPWVWLALALMTGLGLQQNIPGQLAMVGAIAIVVLPAIGLATVLGGRTIAYAFSLAVASWACVWAAPYYFPGERDAAAQVGARSFARSFGEGAADAAAGGAAALLSWFGGPPVPTLRAARATIDPEPLLGATTVPDVEREGPTRAIWIPYEGEGQTIIIPAHVDGPDFGEELKFVFDTGATLTTISAEVLDLLDVQVPEDAPEIMLRTAAGEMQARLVLVDAIWLQQEVVEWVTIAVCEHCASDRADGLLGLNVSSHYRVSIDHEAGELEWVPRRGRRNRRLDIQPWLDMNSVLRRWDDGRLELEIRVGNRAHRAIKRSVLEVSCSDEKFTIHLDPIPAKGSVTQVASLPWGTRCEVFEVVPVAAAWETDRF